MFGDAVHPLTLCPWQDDDNVRDISSMFKATGVLSSVLVLKFFWSVATLRASKSSADSIGTGDVKDSEPLFKGPDAGADAVPAAAPPPAPAQRLSADAETAQRIVEFVSRASGSS